MFLYIFVNLVFCPSFYFMQTINDIFICTKNTHEIPPQKKKTQTRKHETFACKISISMLPHMRECFSHSICLVWLGDGRELKKHSATHCARIGENGETVSISVSTEESHESTLSGTYTHKYSHHTLHTFTLPLLSFWIPHFCFKNNAETIRVRRITFDSSATCNHRNTRRRCSPEGR